MYKSIFTTSRCTC